MNRILEPLRAVFDEGYMVSSRNREWKCHPVVISYSCNIPEGEDMFGVKNDGTFLARVQFLSTWDDVFAEKRMKRRLDSNMEKI